MPRAVSYASERAANSSVRQSASIAWHHAELADRTAATIALLANAVVSSTSRSAAPRQRAATISRSNRNHS